MNIVASWPAPSRTLPEIYPARIGKIILLAYEEVLGSKGLAEALHLAGLAGSDPFTADLPFGAPAHLATAVESQHGEQVGRGLILRAGRATFRRGIREFSGILGLTDRGFRLLPGNQKILRGLDLLAWLMNHYSDQRVRVEKNHSHLLLINERCSHCWERTSSSPCCHLTVGILQEGLAWASSGRHYAVEETTCHSKGDAACTFQISRKPVA